MVATAYCSSCQRTVYVGRGDSGVCPVCSSPLVTGPDEKSASDVLAQRAADNEQRFRRLNEDKEGSWNGAPGDIPGFFCECGDEQCEQTLDLTHEEYDDIRRQPLYFFVVPGHELPEAEIIVETKGRYNIVEKVGPARRRAQRGRRP